MASNEFRACKKAIKRAKTKQEIGDAVDVLDEVWYKSGESEKIMKPADWWRLTLLIHKTITKIK